MSTAGLKSLQAKAWTARFSGELDEANSLLVSAKLALGISLGDLDLDELKLVLDNSEDFNTTVDVLCLLASMERSRGDLEKSRRILALISDASDAKGKPPTSNLFLQHGLNHLIAGRYASALEYFIAGYSESSSPILRLVILTNQIVCMEAMGQNIDKHLKRVREFLDECPTCSVKRSVCDQIDALLVRHHRRHGNITAALDLNSKHSHINQVDYIAQTIRQLPYISDPTSDNDSWHFFIENHRKLQHGSYRLRTLLGQYEERDYDLLCPHVVADRLYFWVWLWLREPASFGVVKIIELLKRVRLDENIWAIEDIRQVRIALLWLGLFSGINKSEILNFTAVFPRSEAKMPLFDFEEMVISYFYEQRGQNHGLYKAIKSSIYAHPLYGSIDIKLGSLVDLKPEPALANLVHSLVQIANLNDSSKEFQVDLRSRTIRCRSLAYENRSHALVLALHLLNKKSFVSFPDLLNSCFGIGNYDPIVHDKKIYNLLYRLRKIPGMPLKFRTKDGLIYSEGNWSSFDFIELCQHEESLLPYANWLQLIGSSEAFSQERSIYQPPAKKSDYSGLADRWVSRSDIQQVLQKPRSTTSRMIKFWVQGGLVKKKGHTKKSLYRIEPELLQQIQRNLYD